MGWRDWFSRPAAPAVWPRPLYTPGEGRAVFTFVVVGGPALSRSASTLPAGVSLRSIGRKADPSAFAAELASLRQGMEGEPAGAAALLPGVDHLLRIDGALPDPPDYAALQAAWARVRAEVQAGAVGVFDRRAGRWHTAHRVQTPDPDPSRLARGFQVRSTSLDGHPGAWVCWTAGLAKAARPDLVILITEAQLPLAQETLLELGEQMSRGRRLWPGARVGLGDHHARLDPLEAGHNAPDLGLDNPNGALLVVLFAGPAPGAGRG